MLGYAPLTQPTLIKYLILNKSTTFSGSIVGLWNRVVEA